MLHCLSRGDAPFVSHLLYTQVLDDSRPDHRRRGIVAGLAMGDTCEERWFFTDLGMSTGMREGQKRAIACNQKHRTIKIGDDWREKYPGKPTQGFADAARVELLEKVRDILYEKIELTETRVADLQAEIDTEIAITVTMEAEAIEEGRELEQLKAKLDGEHLMSPPELAAQLQVTEHTVYTWRASGQGPKFIKLTKRRQAQIRYRRSDVEAWLDACTATKTGEEQEFAKAMDAGFEAGIVGTQIPRSILLGTAPGKDGTDGS